MIKKKTVEDHFSNAPQHLFGLFEFLKTKIFELDKNKVRENTTRPYIGYYFSPDPEKPRLFVEIHIQKRNQKIVLHLRPVEYKDPLGKVFDYNYIPKWPLRRGIDIFDRQDAEYCIPLIKQSYEDVL